jgi:hypothetical protein
MPGVLLSVVIVVHPASLTSALLATRGLPGMFLPPRAKEATPRLARYPWTGLHLELGPRCDNASQAGAWTSVSRRKTFECNAGWLSPAS